MTAQRAPTLVTDRPLIRPPDTAIRGTTLHYMPERQVPSHEAVRRLLHYTFRDAVSVLDLTYGGGGCWHAPLPPGIALTTNDLAPSVAADLHLDYRATGLPSGSFDVPVIDWPHTADNGKSGYFWRQYRGTAKGNAALVEDVVAGALEAWRIARVGIIVKLTDASHGSELVLLSYEVIAALGMRPYAQITAYKPAAITNPRHRAERVPRSNGAIYLTFRKDGPTHKSFDDLYERQPAALRIGPILRLGRCANCNDKLPSGRSHRAYCKDACRQRAYRQRRPAT
jgi:hypothetical protein